MSEKCINIIKSMYVNIRAKFTLGDIESDWVVSKNGVRQGCVTVRVITFTFWPVH